jgi:hypothetical protein
MTAPGAKWPEVHTGRHEEASYTGHGLGLQRRFFDHFLKGADNGWDTEPRGEHAWPLPRTEWTRWYLDADAAALDGSGAPPQAASRGQPAAR